MTDTAIIRRIESDNNKYNLQVAFHKTLKFEFAFEHSKIYQLHEKMLYQVFNYMNRI